MIVTGRARIVGDDINTDYIISSKRKRETIDEAQLVRWLLEGVDPRFAASVQPGDILVAGRNFGCGSAMEVAATVIRAAGIRAVIAKSFARSFFRNAINNGLLVIQCETASIAEGEELSICLDEADSRLEHGGHTVPLTASPPRIMLDILAAGGLVEYLRSQGGFPRLTPLETPSVTQSTRHA
jgi:3-isopropylmalate/(R)-2-methylmalate dehydratase small subunit